MRFFVVASFLLLQGMALAWAPQWASSLLNAGAGLLAVAVAAWCGRRYGWALSRGWGLLAVAWALWALGALLGLQQRLSGVEAAFPALAGVVYLLGLLPLLLAISVVGLERRDPLLRGIDALFLVALGGLYCGIRLRLFGSDFGDVDPVLLADLQNAFLVLLAGVRRAAAENDSERRFFGVLFPFLLLRLVTIAAYNRLVEAGPAQGDAWVWLLPSLSYLLFVLLAPSPKLPAMWPGAARLAPFARAASPLALAVLLLVTSALIVAHGGLAVGLAGIVLGVFGYGFRSTLLLVRTEDAARRLHELARIDELTGIANRRHFDEAFARAWRHAAEAGQPLAVLMIDVDHFKSINDRFGHALGDACLRSVARALVAELGDAPGMLARMGGEEFAVMLPNAGAATAARLAERLRAAVQALTGTVPGQSVQVTVSVGVACAAPGRDDAQQTLVLADRLLYEAKRQGRNRVCATLPA